VRSAKYMKVIEFKISILLAGFYDMRVSTIDAHGRSQAGSRVCTCISPWILT